MPGDVISGPEVSHISRHGLWLLAGDRERFLPFEAFPWFAQASVAQILAVEEPRPGHFHWPELDVDLTWDMIERPDAYPLVSRAG